MLPDPRPTLRI